jgi:hypothetical protein
MASASGPFELSKTLHHKPLESRSLGLPNSQRADPYIWWCTTRGGKDKWDPSTPPHQMDQENVCQRDDMGQGKDDKWPLQWVTCIMF